MIKSRGPHTVYLVLTIIFLVLLIHLKRDAGAAPYYVPQGLTENTGRFDWANIPQHNPVAVFEKVPKPEKSRLPRIQHIFRRENITATILREQRRIAVKDTFIKCWKSYREHAWLHDELTPISGSHKSTFGGWAATLVDSLDTLWIMGLHEEFNEAVEATLSIDFTNTTSITISLFETNIRYLGGLLAAHDLSGDRRLLHKAVELGNVLYAAFDTPNRLPPNSYDLHGAAAGEEHFAEYSTLSAEIGSLSLEFTRLSQLTGDPKWYDAIARITDLFATQQDDSYLPGMWPMTVGARTGNFSAGMTFTLGAMADSMYEYLPKMSLLLSGSKLYEEMYAKSMDTAIKYLLFRPMVPDNADILVAGEITAMSNEYLMLTPHGQHLSCFVGGMFALGGKLIQNDSHVEIGRKITDGCVWTYHNSVLGVMPESFSMLPCESWADCKWDRTEWLDAAHTKALGFSDDPELTIKQQRIPEGFVSLDDRQYLLRPEAIESVFINYRISGDESLMEDGWKMWLSILNATETEFANAALGDMSGPTALQRDSMESFWLAETLKYFYLLYSPTTLISLDEYVFNTEAHPFRRPRPGWW